MVWSDSFLDAGVSGASACNRVASYPHLAAVFPAVVMPGLGLAGAGGAWLAGRRFGAKVDAQGRAAVDFQLTLVLAGAGGWLGLVGGVGLAPSAAAPLLLAAYFLSVVAPIFAAASTSRGEEWRYPLSLRVLQRRAS